MDEITIGKYTLESLTVGMYKDSFTLYREYIQNAADAIDAAISSGILDKDEGKISIDISKSDRSIHIRDNGTGIPTSVAFKLLVDIGNSIKNIRENRGFRGIGRLGGLGYANRLLFQTTSRGENVKSVVTWDCARLRELLQPDKHRDLDLMAVLRGVATYEKKPEKSDSHYFEVSLIEVQEEYEDLIDEAEVYRYVSETGPVPFDNQLFLYAESIRDFFENSGARIDEYAIFLNHSPKPIYKSYKTNFRTGHQERTKEEDHITDIDTFLDRKLDGSLRYCGWLGISHFYGSVQDDFMRGIRIRKGNILIGDENTFGQFFRSEQNRANGVFIGEIHIFDADVIPNARRDDFEKNQAYAELSRPLSVFADEINRKYRRSMSQYNSLAKKVEKYFDELGSIEEEVSKVGITSESHRKELHERKDTIVSQIPGVEVEIKKFENRMESGSFVNKDPRLTSAKIEELKRKSMEVENKITDTDYTAKRQLSFLGTTERKLIEKVFTVVRGCLEKDEANDLIDKIIDAVKPGKRVAR